MPGSPLIQSECKIIMLNKELQDVGEVRKFTQWQHTHKLNEVSSWQLDMRTKDFDHYNIDPSTHFCFYRDNELLLDGPIMPGGIQHTVSTQMTRIIGGCDNAYLATRICYPVVTGPIFDTSIGTWKFGVLRSPVGINSKIMSLKDDKGVDTGIACLAKQEYEVTLIVEDSQSFLEGSTITWLNAGVMVTDWKNMPQGYNAYGDRVSYCTGSVKTCPLRIKAVDLATNMITIDNPQGDCGQGTDGQILAPGFPSGGSLIQTSGDHLVDDPLYLGYDTRVGCADDVAKQLVYFNAGRGACSDHFGTRAIRHLEIGAPTTQGAEVTANSRGENLLTQVQNVCLAGALNFETKLIGNEIVFDTFLGNDLTADGNLVFSLESGNLKDAVYSYGPPTGNFVMGCGPETGVDKLMLPSGNQQSIDEYGRWESWINSSTANAGDTTTQVNANMVLTNNLALAKSTINGALTLTIAETDQVRYPRDFRTGDKVRIIIMTGKRKVSVDEIITNLSYSLPGAGAPSGMGSALTATFTRTQTQQMLAIDDVKKQLQQITMT